MSQYIDSTPKKDNYIIKGFNEPKNVNQINIHRENEKKVDIYNYLDDPLVGKMDDYLLGASFENMNSHIELDDDNNYVFLAKDICGSKQCSDPYPNMVVTSEEEEVIIVNDTVNDEDEFVPPDPELYYKMNAFTQFYIGSLSVIGLLIFFRMMYKVRA